MASPPPRAQPSTKSEPERGEAAVPAQEPAPRSGRRRALWIALGVVGGLALLVRAGVPVALERVLESRLAEALGRPVEVADVDLALLTGGLRIEGLSVGGAPGTGTAVSLLHWDQLDVDIAWRPLLRRELRVSSLGLERPVLRLVQDANGQLEPIVLAAPSAPADEPEPAAEPGAPWALRMDALAVRGARVRIVDAGQGPDPLDVSFEELGFRASEFETTPGRSFPVELDLRLRQGALSVRGRAALDPPDFVGRVTWEGLELPSLARVALPARAAWLRAGRADGELEVVPREGAQLRARGRVALAGLALEDPNSGEALALGFDRLEVVLRELVLPAPGGPADPPTPIRVDLAEVRLDAPHLLYTLVPAEPASEPAPDVAAEPEPAGGPAVALSLGALHISGGELDFRDRGVSPAHRTRVEALEVEVQELGWPEPRARALRARARVGGEGTLALSGGLEPGAGKLRLELQRLALPPFDAYARRAGGYRIDTGAVSLTSDVQLRGERTEARGELVLHRLAVGSGEPGIVAAQLGMPLDVALALLRDLEGNIHLPVALDLEGKDARAHLLPLLGAALRQAVLGAVASPLKMVGAALRGVEGALSGADPLPGTPGEAALALGNEERLATVARLLQSRPALALVLRGRAGAPDHPAVAERLLTERLAAGEPLPELADEPGWLARRRIRAALEARRRGEEGALGPEDEAALERYRAAVPVPSEPLDALARQRAELVRDRLVADHGLDPQRVQVGEPAPAGAPGVLLELAVAGAGTG